MKTELELRQLRVLLAVVDAGAHTRAARALGISQSTVSETLSALERAIGTSLLRKSGKGSALTPAGEALVPYARRMLALSSELVGALSKVASDVSATLAISAVESLSTYVLPAALAALRERWPGARIEVATAACADIREHVASGRSDLGLTIEQVGAAATAVIANARLLVVASPSHPLAHRSASAERLAEHDIYMSESAGDYHQVLRQYFEAAHVEPPRLQALGTIEGVKHGVLAAGTPLALVPAHAVEKELREGVLAQVELRPALPLLAVRALVAAPSASSPMVDDLIELLGSVPSLAGIARPGKAARSMSVG